MEFSGNGAPASPSTPANDLDNLRVCSGQPGEMAQVGLKERWL